MTFAQRRNRVTTHFSERIPAAKRGLSEVYSHAADMKTIAAFLRQGSAVVLSQVHVQ